MSFTLNGTYRDIANNSLINPPEIYSTGPYFNSGMRSGHLSPYGHAARIRIRLRRARCPPRQTRWEINPRFDTMIGTKNTFTARYSYETGIEHKSGR